MDDPTMKRYTAFEGARRLVAGGLAEVARRTKEVVDGGTAAAVLIFDDATGESIDVDWRGTAEEVAERYRGSGDTTPPAGPGDRARGPGRPRLGVVAREVTLLPRHWDWLATQPGGASVALRKLVEEARRANAGKDRARRSQEAAYRFMAALGGDLPGFEEATRALFAGDRERFDGLVGPWPADVRDHARGLAAAALAGEVNG